MKSIWAFMIVGLVASGSFSAASPVKNAVPGEAFHLSLSNPMGGEVYSAGAVIRIEWIEVQAHNMTNWDMLYSTDGGVIFRSIKFNLAAHVRSYLWTVPDINTNQAQIRVIQDNQTVDYTATSPNFTIQSVVTGVEFGEELPETPQLFANFPNPFSSSTEIGFGLPRNSHVVLEVFDVAGVRVAMLADRLYPAGQYRLRWVADHVPSGSYFSRLIVNDQVHTSSMVIVR